MKTTGPESTFNKIATAVGEVADRTLYQMKMLKHRPRLWWNALFIRKDEFHSSLSMDVFAMSDMNKADRERYLRDLAKRRKIAHERDLNS